MNEQIKAKWVAALRSGEYEQCSNALNNGAAFCCLGVLCDLKDPEGWTYSDNEDERLIKFGGESELPPHEVHDWAGFPPSSFADSRVPVVWINGKSKPLHEHNDDGATFAQLADAIEAQVV